MMHTKMFLQEPRMDKQHTENNLLSSVLRPAADE